MGELHVRLGAIAMARESYREAVASFERAISAFEEGAGPNVLGLVPALTMLARARWRLGDRPGAQIAMARSVALQKSVNAETVAAVPEGAVIEEVGRDEWLLYQGDADAAAKGFGAKIEFEDKSGQTLDPEPAPYHEKLAEAEEMAGRLDAAREAFEQAAVRWEKLLSPGHPRAQWCRRRAAETGRTSEAA